MNFNFTMSSDWINALYIRYDIDKIKVYDNLYFYEDKSILKCQNFFNFNISEKVLEQIKKEIENNKKVRFSYFDNQESIERLKIWARKNNFKFEELDCWASPVLDLNTPLNVYIDTLSSNQIKKNYKKYIKNKEKFQIKNSKNEDVLRLWKDVLVIDYNSWKREENSDMKSLDREDLQYLPMLLNNPLETSLQVIYKKGIPLGYTLMFKNKDTWFNVKWGSSYEGRKECAGFFCLFNHIEYLYSVSSILSLDFWGRRNKTYDDLKNNEIKRCHIIISKE